MPSVNSTLLTNFPNGITSLGVPTFGAGGLLPFTGNYWWVNQTSGADGNSGMSPDQAFKTLARAVAVATDSNDDVVFFQGTISTAATIAWNKNWLHLIGLTAPSVNSRARISQTGATVFTPMVKVTGEGCVFANFSTFYGYNSDTAQVCWEDNGGRNAYYSTQFLGGGNATAAANAGMRSLLVSGVDGENIFTGCTIGLDTVVRATGTNASLEFTNHTCRNRFLSCVFQADVTQAADTHVTVGSGGIDRYALFEGCVFLNFGTTMNANFAVNASAGGNVLLKNCTSLGATAFATAGPIYIDGTNPYGAGNEVGLAVPAT